MSTFQFKRGNNINFSSVNLAAGEPAFIIDTGKLYVGNGTDKTLINPINKIVGLNTTDTFTKFTVNEYGQITTASAITESDLPSISTNKITGLGTAATANVGLGEGELALLDENGKLPITVIPDTVTVEVYEISSESQMLALNAQKGDVAVRSDIKANFILKAAPADVLSNWVKLLVPEDAVNSVNGKTGAVIIYASDINLNGYVKAAAYSEIVPADTTDQAFGKLEKNFDNYAKIDSPTFQGSPLAPTPAANDNTTKIATTAFVTTALSIIDGGTF